MNIKFDVPSIDDIKKAFPNTPISKIQEYYSSIIETFVTYDI
jgi:hypothetical protein